MPVLKALAQVARDARTRAAVRRHEIAVTANVYPSTVDRFERAEAWPRNPEGMIRAYAKHVGMPAADLWLEAIVTVTEEAC